MDRCAPGAAHPENYLGSPEIWRQAENDLRELAKAEGATLVEAPGEAAFYGPKVDFMVSDSIGREWQVATIQLDMNLPNRFDLYCINEKGEKERIVMIHAAIMGSIERFLAPLIEHFAGALPLWVSPVQVAVLTVTDKHQAFAEQVAKELEAANIRVETKFDDNTLGKKIKEVKLFKTPYVIIIGDREASSQTLTVETREGKKLENISVADFVVQLQKEIKEKK
jgi:threonyl-tRNA synthetase